MARKRTSSGFKKGKHGSKRDIFEDIDEESLRKDIRKSVRKSDSRKAKLLPYAILISVIAILIGAYAVWAFVIDKDTDDPSTVVDTSGQYDLALRIETKTGGGGDHAPYDFSSHKVDPAVGTQYLLLLKNRGELTDSFAFSSDAPGDWTVVFEGGDVLENVPKAEWMYQVVTIRLNSGSSDTYREIKITATSIGDPEKSDSVTTKNTVENFPAERADLDKSPAKVDYNLVYYGGGKDSGEMGWYHNQGSEFTADNVIVGFKETIKGMKVGQTLVVEVPPEKGYGKDDPKHVDGKSLIFEITMLDVTANG